MLTRVSMIRLVNVLEACYDWSIIVLPNDIIGCLELSLLLRDNFMVMLILQIAALENFLMWLARLLKSNRRVPSKEVMSLY